MRKIAPTAVVAAVLWGMISFCNAAGITYPAPQSSDLVSTDSPTKLRIESFDFSPGIDLCLAWLYGSSVNYSRFSYQVSFSPVVKSVNNPPPSSSYVDVDVVDGTTDCNVVALEAMKFYISGNTLTSLDSPNAAQIGVSFLPDSGFRAMIRDNTDNMSPFTDIFAQDIETRRLTSNSILVATGLKSNRLFIASVTSSGYTVLGNFSTGTTQPRSISAAVYSESNWVVCAIVTTTTANLGCVFSIDPTEIKTVSTGLTIPTLTAISFIDCTNVVFVYATASYYTVNLLDVTTFAPNLGGYTSLLASGISALHVATTNRITSVVTSNSSGIFMDMFTWSYASAGCEGIPNAVPAGSPGSGPSTPQISPQASPQSTSQGGSTPGSQSPESNVQQQPNAAGVSPSSVDPVALGVGVAVPLAVLGVGVFLLVFLLRKRNKKKKANQGVNQMNPVKDIDNAQPPSDTGVYRNLPSNNASNNAYTSLGNVTNDTFATASTAIELPDIDKRLHIPYKSLVFIKEIGAGSYGKVFLGEWRGAKVAIKVNNQITDVDGFLAEAKLTLGIAPHPNLVQTFGVSLDGPNPCIVLEYCGGGSLDQVLYDTDNDLSVEKQREYAMKIAYGLLHLHNNNIVHRDLAARNILLTNDQQPKISDFGMSRIIQEENSKGHTKTNFGPIRWMAPESLRDRSYSVKSDVWTYGVVVSEILSRQEPHVNEDQLSIAVKIRDQAATPQIPSNGDPVLVEVIHKCLKAEPKDRPTMEELCRFMRAKID